MKDPKTFYRELDSLLATIRIEKTQGNLLADILKILEENFSQTVCIRHGRLYEQRGEDFLLVYPQNPRPEWVRRIAKTNKAVELVSHNRSYIFDTAKMNAAFYQTLPENEIPLCTAIWVHNQETSWLLIFELTGGWIREEINLFMNAIRTSLNYRLFTDMMGGRLEQAVQIQKSLLPKVAPKFAGYDIFGHSDPAELVGGDFYDYNMVDDHTLSVSIGDASGHGIPAALLVRDVVIGLRMGLAKEFRNVHMLERLNKVIQKSTYSTNFVSLFLCEIEKDGHIFYVNAGHPGPFLISDNGIEDLEATGITLGFLPDINLSRSHVYMPEGSILVLFTDGIIERGELDGDQLGLQALKKLVYQNRDKTAEQLSDLIFETAFEYGQRKAWEDDVTVVIIKRKALL